MRARVLLVAAIHAHMLLAAHLMDEETGMPPPPETSAPLFRWALQGAHTHTLFYLAQVSGALGDADTSASYCYMTLSEQVGMVYDSFVFRRSTDCDVWSPRRLRSTCCIPYHTLQLEGEVKLDRLGWVTNCLSLVDYHLTASQSDYKAVRTYGDTHMCALVNIRHVCQCIFTARTGGHLPRGLRRAPATQRRGHAGSFDFDHYPYRHTSRRRSNRRGGQAGLHESRRLPAVGRPLRPPPRGGLGAARGGRRSRAAAAAIEDGHADDHHLPFPRHPPGPRRRRSPIVPGGRADVRAGPAALPAGEQAPGGGQGLLPAGRLRDGPRAPAAGAEPPVPPPLLLRAGACIVGL